MEQKLNNNVVTQAEMRRRDDGEIRPWGGFMNLASGPMWNIKIIEIVPNRRLSLQFHNKREECLMLLDGDCKVDDGKGNEIAMARATMYHVPVGSVHRMSSVNGGRVAEISYGDFDEADIVRLEDDFGRIA